jgi:glyoxylase-like metal-dependent hydrolase (beta-lactamase superfamily II)
MQILRIHPKIFQIRLWWPGAHVEADMYLLNGKIKAVVDAGPPGAASEMIDSLKKLGLNLSDIDLILITHAHRDHTGGILTLKSAKKAKLLLHKDEAIMLENHDQWFERDCAPLLKVIRGPDCLGTEKQAFLEAEGNEVMADNYLKENDIIDLGGGLELKAIHLPGHTSGSLGYYMEKDGILFAGDSVSGRHIEGGRLPVFTDFKEYRNTIKRLSNLPLKLFLCHHQYRGITLSASTIRRDLEINKYLRESEDIINTIVRAIEDTKLGKPNLTFLEMTNQVISKLPPNWGFQQILGLPPANSSPHLYPQTIFWILRQIGINSFRAN